MPNHLRMGANKNYKFYAERSGSAVSGDSKGNASSSTIKQFVEWTESLSFEEAICLVYDVNFSDLSDFYWTVTFEDIVMKLKLYMTRRQIDYHQQFEILMLAVKNIFGSAEKPSEADIIDEKIKSLPVLSDKDSIAAFFQRNQ